MKRIILFTLITLSLNAFSFENQPKEFTILDTPSSKVTGIFDPINYEKGIKCGDIKSKTSALKIGRVTYDFLGVSGGNADESCFDSIQNPTSELRSVRLVYSERETGTQVIIFITAQAKNGLSNEFGYNFRFAQGVTARSMKISSKY